MMVTQTVIHSAVAEPTVKRETNPVFDLSGMHHIRIGGVLFSVTVNELQDLAVQLADVLLQCRIADAERVNVPLFSEVAS